MKPLFLAGTRRWTSSTRGRRRTASRGAGRRWRAFAAWLENAALLDGLSARQIERRFGAEALDAAAAEARKLRECARLSHPLSPAPKRDYSVELQRLNRILEGARRYRQLVETAGGLQLKSRSASNPPMT